MDEQFPALALQAVGYRSAYHGEKSYNGVAILSKSEPRDVRDSPCDEVVDPHCRLSQHQSMVSGLFDLRAEQAGGQFITTITN